MLAEAQLFLGERYQLY